MSESIILFLSFGECLAIYLIGMLTTYFVFCLNKKNEYIKELKIESCSVVWPVMAPLVLIVIICSFLNRTIKKIFARIDNLVDRINGNLEGVFNDE